MKSLLGEIRQSGLYEANDILDAIAMINQKKPIELDQRGLLGKVKLQENYNFVMKYVKTKLEWHYY